MNTIEKIQKEGIKLTPMMEQYFSIKKDHPDDLLLFRMGDFYELFFEDAKEASRILNITLTTRGKLGPYPIPMAGIPHHAASAYVNRITDAGKKAAICEQIEDPKATKGIVKRGVTQVASPGIPFDLEKSSAEQNHYIAAVFKKNNSYSLSLVDFTTGQFFGHVFSSEEELLTEIRKYEIKEFLTFHGQWTKETALGLYLKNSAILTSEISKEAFDYKLNKAYLKKFIPHFEKDEFLQNEQTLLNSIASLAFYVCSTQTIESLCHISPYKVVHNDKSLKITIPTLRGLEILPKSNDDYKNSLLGFMDHTKTSLGKRKLRDIFLSPLRELDLILDRQSYVNQLIQDQELLDSNQEYLSEIKDLRRILALTANNKVANTHLFNLVQSLRSYLSLTKSHSITAKEYLKLTRTEQKKITDLCDEIEQTLNEELGASLDKGNLIKSGFNKKRDRLAKSSFGQEELIKELEENYRKKTGISKLKIKQNNVAGYYIEVSKIHSDKVPKKFVRKQTLVNSERYMTTELTELEKNFVIAKEKLESLEKQIYEDLLELCKSLSKIILKIAENTAFIDVLSSFAYASKQSDFSLPNFSIDRKLLKLEGAWHPLIKNQIDDLFVPHDIELNSKDYFALITGPNMAGKTTVMREIAIVQFLAQLGCLVPAEHASLPLVDLIFSRLGASDDILNGQSTFMVEMAETAEILRHSTKDSLILLDEVGRGTSTYDGLSIAWALVEHITAKIGCFTLFSTHYHELIDLADKLPGAKNLTVQTRNNGEDIEFLYKLIEQGANQSFGIYVAKMAGLPQSILKRSQTILNNLESEASSGKSNEPVVFQETQLSLLEDDQNYFASHLNHGNSQEPDEKIKAELQDIDINNLTPMQALQELHNLKELIQ